MHGGVTWQVMKPKAPPDCVAQVEPVGQSASVAQVGRAPAGQDAMHALMFVVLGVFALGK
jgi:hypothetical protein